MDLLPPVESGLQVFTRFTCAPQIKPLHTHLLPDGPDPGQVIELLYDDDVPQNLLICDLVSKTILPFKCGGKNADTAILITDGHFNILSLVKMLRISINSNMPILTESELENAVEECLKKLHIMTIYDSHNFFITIESLDSLLALNLNISLVVIDTITAFYWSDRMEDSAILKMDLYIKKILNSIQSATKEYKPVILYTKPSCFISNDENIDCVDALSEEPVLEKVNYKMAMKIYAENDEESIYQITVTNFKTEFVKKFNISGNELKWL